MAFTAAEEVQVRKLIAAVPALLKLVGRLREMEAVGIQAVDASIGQVRSLAQSARDSIASGPPTYDPVAQWRDGLLTAQGQLQGEVDKGLLDAAAVAEVQKVQAEIKATLEA